jgi:uncharacterized protein DUF3300
MNATESVRSSANREYFVSQVRPCRVKANQGDKSLVRKLGIPISSLLIVMLVLQSFSSFLQAQASVPTPDELDQLLAPVELYPDSLLSQITTASTNPQEILDADNWLHQHRGLTGTPLTDAAEKPGFDPAFIALVNFPNVLAMMAQNIDDYAHWRGVHGRPGRCVRVDSAFTRSSLRSWNTAQQFSAGSASAAGGRPNGVCHSASQSADCLRAAIRSNSGVCRKCCVAGDDGHFRSRHRHRSADGHQPALGMGWMGLELGCAALLLQS